MNNDPTVSVIIGIRNRYDFRIYNALKSLRTQSYPASKISIILVDYGSDIAYRDAFNNICEKYSAQGIWTDTKTAWNRSHCLNIGIKHSSSEYVLVSDVDIIFEKNYVESCITAMKQDPQQAIYTPMYEIKKGMLNREIDLPEQYAFLRQHSSRRKRFWDFIKPYPYGQSILFVERKELENIHGYDEQYELWGCEDDDIVRRLQKIGITTRSLDPITSHIHQWHPKFENISDNPTLRSQIKKNFAYLRSHDSVVRNPVQWGELP